ncbi:MAG TPA: flagellar biosynthesis protein FlgD [Peptococcaceae bacterium]|nr:flagellar biosynthesis protein FlgD [Peptococcaceae bacterium]
MPTVYGPNYSNYNSLYSKPESKIPNQELGKDEFLKLLIAQLRNQDPMNPMQDTEFIAQMAQFSALEQTIKMYNSLEAMRTSMNMLLNQSLLTQGAALIGKEAVGIDNTGQEVFGRINSIKLSDSFLQVMIGDTLVNLENIIEIKEAIGEEIPEEELSEEGIPGEGLPEVEPSEETGEIADEKQI